MQRWKQLYCCWRIGASTVMKMFIFVMVAFFATLSVAAAADLPVGKHSVGAAARSAPARPSALGRGERGGGQVAPERPFGGEATGGLHGGMVPGPAPVAPKQPEQPIDEGAGASPPAGAAHGEQRGAGGGSPEHNLEPPAGGQAGATVGGE